MVGDKSQFSGLEAKQNQLAALYRVSQVLGTSLDLNEVLNQVMDAVIELTHAERGFLMLLDADTQALSLRAARNIEHETLRADDMEISRTVIHTVVESGNGVVTTDAQKDPRFAGQESVVFFALRSILCAPLRARGKIIGVIYVDNRAQSGMFTDDDLEMLNAFATQAAITIENARLYTRTDQALSARVLELETLTQIDRELSASLDLDHVVDVTRRWAVAGTNAQKSFVLVGDKDGNLYAPGGDNQKAAQPLEGALSDAVTASIQEMSLIALQPLGDVLAQAIVPLLSAGQALGVLVIERGTPFVEVDLQFLERLARRSGAAMQNALLFEDIQQANTAKTKFVSVVTHELRIPMTSIKGYTDLLRAGAVGPVNEMQQNFLNVVRNNVDRMSALVSDLSDISRIETGRLKLNLDFIEVYPFIQDTLNSLKPKLDEKGQVLLQELPGDLPKVYADPNRLVQILTNLVSNAWKYTPANGQIMIRAAQGDTNIRLEVIDTGIGISPEDQSQLFSQFFRSEDPAVREQQGWGLGLNVTKRLVEIMEGEMGFSSTLGAGSIFWFTLPTLKPEGVEVTS